MVRALSAGKLSSFREGPQKSGTIDASISNRIQEMEERISGAKDSIKKIDTTSKKRQKEPKLTTSMTGRTNTASGTGSIIGLHLLP